MGRFHAPHAGEIGEEALHFDLGYSRAHARGRARQLSAMIFRFSRGIEVPESVELYDVPATVEVPAVRRYRYTVIDNQVVLVDPRTRRIVEIIRE